MRNVPPGKVWARLHQCGRAVIAGATLAAAGCFQLPKVPELPTPKVLAQREKQKVAMAQLLERRGQPDEAKHIYTGLIEKNPKHGLAQHRLGVMAAQEGKFAEADEHFLRAWQVGPPTAALLNDMGYRLYLENRLNEAEKLFRDALALDANYQSALNNLGLVLGQEGRFQESMMAFRQANDEAEAEANLAYILSQHGQLAAAQAHYSRALTLNQDLRPAAQGLLQVNAREERQRLAYGAARSRQQPLPTAMPSANMPPAQPAINQVAQPGMSPPPAGWPSNMPAYAPPQIDPNLAVGQSAMLTGHADPLTPGPWVNQAGFAGAAPGPAIMPQRPAAPAAARIRGIRPLDPW
jgi:Flp pilus assembly protein TadD